jgi:hypothetical protein
MEYEGQNRDWFGLAGVEAGQVAEQLCRQAGVHKGFMFEQQVQVLLVVGRGEEREQQVGLLFAERFVNQAGGFRAQGVEVEMGLERWRQGQAEKIPRLVDVGEEVAHKGVMGVVNQHTEVLSFKF